MSAETILYIILSLLRADNANNLDKPVGHNHLVEVSQAIEAHATASVPAERLISLAYNESRFGYRHVQKGSFPKSGWGACGIYQQVPKFSQIKTTCKKLGTDVDHATKVAVAYLDYMIDRWSIKGSSKMDKRMCHYYSGNRCDDEAREYSKRHRRIRLKARKLRSKAKRKAKVKVALKVPKTPVSVSYKTKSLREMTREEWRYALHHEQDESRRAELGLPPNKL